MSTTRLALLALSAFAAVESLTVASTGYDVFYSAPVEAEYRSIPASKWAAGALLAGLLALGVKA